MKEQWKYVAATDYEVSTHGRLRVKRDGEYRYLKHKNNGTYIVGPPRKLCTQLHRIVLTTFIRPPKDNECCHHINGIPDDNRLENLQWMDIGDHVRYHKAKGTNNKIEVVKYFKRKGHILTEKEYEDFEYLVKCGYYANKLSYVFKISYDKAKGLRNRIKRELLRI